MFRRPDAICLLASLLVGSHVFAADNHDRIGIYHWGGERTSSMSQGVNRIASIGGRVARVAYSPLYHSDYNTGEGCYPSFTLTKFASEPDVETALDDSRIRVLILTTYDGTTFGDCYTHKYLNPRFYTAENIEALTSEYTDFVLHLFRRYGGTGRRFIISNWEGDNAIYCGDAYSYSVIPKFRAKCDSNYPLYYEGNLRPEQSLEGMRLWLRTREDAIREGVNLATSLGLSGIEVLHAPEISTVRLVEQAGFLTVLRNVLPSIRPKYVSYSSYESLNRDDPVTALSEDIGSIRAMSGASQIILGEAGYSRAQWGESGVARLERVFRRALELDVAYIICWNLNDQGSASDFGMFDSSDTLTPSGRLIAKELGSNSDPVQK